MSNVGDFIVTLNAWVSASRTEADHAPLQRVRTDRQPKDRKRRTRRKPVRDMGEGHHRDDDHRQRAEIEQPARARRVPLAHAEPVQPRQHRGEHPTARQERVWIGCCVDAIHRAAHRLAQPPHQQRERETRQRRDDQRELPAMQQDRRAARFGQPVPPVSRDPAERERPADAERDRRGEHRHDETAPVFGPVIIDQAGARGLARRLADADAEPRRREHAEAVRQPAKRGRGRPEQQRDRQQPRADPAIGQPPERQREQSVEQRKNGAEQQAHLGIADVQVGLDRGREDGENLPVEQAHRLSQRDEPKRVARALRHQSRRRPGRDGDSWIAHSLNTRSALVCISFFLVASLMSSRSWVRTSSATYSYG
jgi:hypothetical protein